MTSGGAVVRIRRMDHTDVERVYMIAWSRKHAPRWPKTAYQAALKPDGKPMRIALVAEDATDHPGHLVLDWKAPDFVEPEKSPIDQDEADQDEASQDETSQDETSQDETRQYETKRGRIVGFLVARVVAEHAELESIAVSASVQRRGIGRKLLEAMEEALRTAEVQEVFLEVRASNLRAQAFYRSLGWTETGRRPRYYGDPEEDAVLMSLKRS